MAIYIYVVNEIDGKTVATVCCSSLIVIILMLFMRVIMCLLR